MTLVDGIDCESMYRAALDLIEKGCTIATWSSSILDACGSRDARPGGCAAGYPKQRSRRARREGASAVTWLPSLCCTSRTDQEARRADRTTICVDRCLATNRLTATSCGMRSVRATGKDLAVAARSQQRRISTAGGRASARGGNSTSCAPCAERCTERPPRSGSVPRGCSAGLLGAMETLVTAGCSGSVPGRAMLSSQQRSLPSDQEQARERSRDPVEHVAVRRNCR